MNEHRLAVVGSRGFISKLLVFEILSDALRKAQANNQTITVISGGAKGVDSWAIQWAKSNNLNYVVHLPDWDIHGRSAGFKRNYTIWNDSTCGIAFWDGKSKGTEHSFKIAKDQNKPLRVITLTTHLN